MVRIAHLCRHLRWKSHARSGNDIELLAESMARNQVQFSCRHTCQSWGPDDDLAAPECCTPQRECYARDPILPGREDVS